jgi:hypothetical protein
MRSVCKVNTDKKNWIVIKCTGKITVDEDIKFMIKGQSLYEPMDSKNLM